MRCSDYLTPFHLSMAPSLPSSYLQIGIGIRILQMAIVQLRKSLIVISIEIIAIRIVQLWKYLLH